MVESKRDRIVPILYLIRGLPGSGKTTYANSLGCIVIAPSDMMSRKGGEYRWVRENYMISKMHFREIVRSLMSLQIDIAITELLPERRFINFWLKEARDYQYEVRIKTLKVDVETACKRNIHQADHKSISELDEQFDYSIEDQAIDFSEIDNGPLLKPYKNPVNTLRGLIYSKGSTVDAVDALEEARYGKYE